MQPSAKCRGVLIINCSCRSFKSPAVVCAVEVISRPNFEYDTARIAASFSTAPGSICFTQPCKNWPFSTYARGRTRTPVSLLQREAVKVGQRAAGVSQPSDIKSKDDDSTKTKTNIKDGDSTKTKTNSTAGLPDRCSTCACAPAESSRSCRSAEPGLRSRAGTW